MVEAFLEAGGENNEDFRCPLRSIKQKLDTALLDIGYKDKEQAATIHMTSLELMPTDVCNFAEDLYQVRHEKGNWPPAKSVHDAKRPPNGYGANIGEVGSPLTAAQVLLLIQQNANGGNGGGGKKGNCHGCGSSDHWLRDCPKRKNQQGGGNRNGNNGRNRNGNNGNRNQRGNDGGGNNAKTSWRNEHKAGEPKTKIVNGKTFH
jgi:hypothetical protein